MDGLLARIHKALRDEPDLITSDSDTDYCLYLPLEEPELFEGELDHRGDNVLCGTTDPVTRSAIEFYINARTLLEECAMELERLSNERKGD